MDFIRHYASAIRASTHQCAFSTRDNPYIPHLPSENAAFTACSAICGHIGTVMGQFPERMKAILLLAKAGWPCERHARTMQLRIID